MKYALLVYGDESFDRLPAEQKRSRHAAHRALHDEHEASPSATAKVVAHRFRPPEQTTTIRLAGDEITRTHGPSGIAAVAPRALYLLESDDPAAVLDLAARLPAVRIGATAEIWPLIEPKH